MSRLVVALPLEVETVRSTVSGIVPEATLYCALISPHPVGVPVPFPVIVTPVDEPA
jgi:hypothetical protein